MRDRRAGGANEISIVLTTLPDLDSAQELVRTLVEEGTIACGNIVPGLRSIYRWDGEVVNEGEVLVLMKTAPDRVERLFGRVSELHPYSVPEIVQLPVESASGPYGRWVIESTRGSE